MIIHLVVIVIIKMYMMIQSMIVTLMIDNVYLTICVSIAIYIYIYLFIKFIYLLLFFIFYN